MKNKIKKYLMTFIIFKKKLDHSESQKINYRKLRFVYLNFIWIFVIDNSDMTGIIMIFFTIEISKFYKDHNDNNSISH